jgi:hypothetical protein
MNNAVETKILIIALDEEQFIISSDLNRRRTAKAHRSTSAASSTIRRSSGTESIRTSWKDRESPKVEQQTHGPHCHPARRALEALTGWPRQR